MSDRIREPVAKCGISFIEVRDKMVVIHYDDGRIERIMKE